MFSKKWGIWSNEYVSKIATPNCFKQTQTLVQIIGYFVSITPLWWGIYAVGIVYQVCGMGDIYDMSKEKEKKKMEL